MIAILCDHRQGQRHRHPSCFALGKRTQIKKKAVSHFVQITFAGRQVAIGLPRILYSLVRLMKVIKSEHYGSRGKTREIAKRIWLDFQAYRSLFQVELAAVKFLTVDSCSHWFGTFITLCCNCMCVCVCVCHESTSFKMTLLQKRP